MGAGNSVEIPGGGTEGYHVLRVSNGAISGKKMRFRSKIQLEL